MRINKIIILLLIMLTMASCHSGSDPDYNDGSLTVIGDIEYVRARNQGYEWTPGDVIGLSSDAGQNNIPFTTEGNGVFTSTQQVKVTDQGSVNYTAYYPFVPYVTASSPVISFDKPIDFMWAKTSATRKNPKAVFLFKHVMTWIYLTFIDDREENRAQKGTVRIDGFSISGQFNTLTGVVTADDTLSHEEDEFSPFDTVKFIMPGQSLAQGVDIKVHYLDMDLHAHLYLTQLTAGAQYNYSINLTRANPNVDLSVSSPTITGWESEDEEEIEIKRE